ncbi:MAG: chemotaxis protein CheW [Candidatus Sericytochromatia bacterium]|nr:chemotaxis protein CheW [Candidatus Sericytochromatia bacterium]
MCVKAYEDIQVVVFKLDNDEYCVPVSQAREIQTYTIPTRIPNTPEFVEGVINLRGQIIPILDLKKRFKSGATDINIATRVIIIDMDGELIGIIVDTVSEVLKISSSRFEIPPEAVKTSINSNYISSIGKIDGRLIIMVDLAKVLNDEEKEQLKN